MKKIFLLPLLMGIVPSVYGATTYWWNNYNENTICRPINSGCYSTNMGDGYDLKMWDPTGNNNKGCWGVKYICPEALKSVPADGRPVTQSIAGIRTNTNPDFDTTQLGISDDGQACFGKRSVNEKNHTAVLDGKDEKIWCEGILESIGITKTIAVTYGKNQNEGFITSDTVTCQALADRGILGVLNGDCFGKERYGTDDGYFIECGNASVVTPSTIVVLNGGTCVTNSKQGGPTQKNTNTTFRTMVKTSKELNKKYYNK